MSEVTLANIGGIPIKTNNGIVKAQYDALLKAATQHSNYWALTAVRTIESICSGRMKSCVYVDEKDVGPRAFFKVLMPGCCAELMQRSNGEYLLIKLVADTQYSLTQRKGDAPGYYEVKEVQSRQSIKFIKDGIVTKDRFPVAISDSSSSIFKATETSTPYMGKAPNTSILDGFGIHFTPGETKIGGLKNITQAYNSDSDSSLNESAMLLASTMEKSRSRSGLVWVSVHGGSGILTRALQLLKSKKIDFNNTNHQIFFAGPTTQVVTAEKLAQEVGLNFDRNNKYFDAYNLDQFIGAGRFWGSSTIASWQRRKYDPNHTTLKAINDTLTIASGHTGSINKITAVGKAVATLGGTTAIATASSGGVAPFIGLGVALVGVAPTVFQSFFPDKYHKISGKF